MTKFQSQDIANTVWSLAHLLCVDAPLLDAISSQALQRLSEFSAQNLSNTAWAFATHRWVDSTLFHAISAAARRLLH